MAEESIFVSGLSILRDMGFFDFFLPFLLFFAVIYGTLAKTEVFGKDAKNINSIVAFVISLIAATTAWVIKGLTDFLPWVGFIAIVVVSFLMIASMIFGGSVEKLYGSRGFRIGALIIIVLVFFVVIYYTLGLSSSVGAIGLSETDFALLVMLGVGLVVLYMIFKGPTTSSGGTG